MPEQKDELGTKVAQLVAEGEKVGALAATFW